VNREEAFQRREEKKISCHTSINDVGFVLMKTNSMMMGPASLPNKPNSKMTMGPLSLPNKTNLIPQQPLQPVKAAATATRSNGVAAASTASRAAWYGLMLLLGCSAIGTVVYFVFFAKSSSSEMSAPSAPTQLQATAGNQSASIAFAAPASNGGSAITRYDAVSNDGHTGTSLSSPLIVSGLTNGTTYTFTVTATNAKGTSVASDPSNAVTPATVPAAPSNVVATSAPASGTVSVAFSPPTNTGGSPLQSYTVTSNPDSKTATGTSSPILITGLTNGENYTFSLTAANATGSSISSPASNIATPSTVPNPPTNVVAVAGGNSASVTFSAPTSNGGSVVTGYTITSSPSGLTATATSAAQPVVVSGLTNGQVYTFIVTATNAKGTSAASAASLPVTPTAVPGSPTNVLATVGNATATITCTAPVSSGGLLITSYTATASPGGLTGTSSTEQAIYVNGLTNGQAYTFTVTATNANGTGLASQPSSQALRPT